MVSAFRSKYKALEFSGRFFFDDCRKNQRQFGVRAYNKIKHGLLVVPEGKDYVKDAPNGIAMLIEGAKDTPILYIFKDNVNGSEERHRTIYFIQCGLRLISVLYVCKFYPDILSSQGFRTIKSLFTSAAMHDVRHFLNEISIKSN